MKTVGLVTFWNSNYGSALQCYATKKTVEKSGFHCDLLVEVNRGLDKYKHKIKKIVFLSLKSLKDRGFYREYKLIRKNYSYDRTKISSKSKGRIAFFAKTQLKPRPCSTTLLRQLGKDEKYVKFIAGSDQIWSASAPINPVCFLSFAPDEKKIALAPSFGSGTLPSYNRGDFKKYISKFPYLSAREGSGVRIIKELTGKDAPRLSDPTAMLTPDEWREFSKNGKAPDEPYILVHFLNKPSDKAKNMLGHLAESTGLKVIVFAYPHDELENLTRAEFIDGDPRDYVKLIDNAKYVLTDSFHSSVFSIYMQSEFFVFERDYNGIKSQGSRIETLLSTYSYNERYISGDDERDFDDIINNPLHNCDKTLSDERKAITEYLQSALGEDSTADQRLNDEYDCTGCGACIACCPCDAISFTAHKRYGYALPVIDESLCINCGKCEGVCKGALVTSGEQKSAYIVYNKNTELRKKSASGGAFSALATGFIDGGGYVVGAVMDFNGESVRVKHSIASTHEELIPILNSKYVQSDCSGVYLQVKKLLKDDKRVLFSGTSCQVDSLYRYLSGVKLDNLYTVDLICHGVPGESFFATYIRYLESKYKCQVKNFSFRKKGNSSFYIMTVDALKSGKNISLEIPLHESAYYQMFMSADSYRESCYSCKFSAIDKPADITLGDYYEAKDDYPELFNGEVESLSMNDGISSVILHTDKGRELFASVTDTLWSYEVDVIKVQNSHNELCKPQTYSKNRKPYFDIYNKRGFKSLERKITRRIKFKRTVKRIIKKIIKRNSA